MTEKITKRLLLCTCSDTMAVDGKVIGQALERGTLPVHRQLCRGDIGMFETALDDAEPVLVACTQEEPLFREIADERQAGPKIGFVNIRERAGWYDGEQANAKMAALVAGALYESRPARLKTIESNGMCLVYGKGQVALDTARTLSDHLSVTLVWSDPEEAVLPSVLDFAVYRGKLVEVTGALGNFTVRLDAYAPLLPSSRQLAEFLMPRDGAQSDCAVIVDLAGETPFVTGWRKRDGYLRAEPEDALAVARLLLQASSLVGTFEKPIYAEYDAGICAHGRSGITGCSKCLDHCPAGALTSLGETIALNEAICGGCGACSSHCPTGAISYAYPDRQGLIENVLLMLSTYRRAGGIDPVLMFHGEGHGGEMIDVMARFGRGLPANVIPIGLHSAGIPGHDLLVSALAAGATRIMVLGDPKNQADLTALGAEIELANSLVAEFRHTEDEPVSLICETDPDSLENILHDVVSAEPIGKHQFSAVGGKREVARTALTLLHGAADNPPDVVALPDHAPYGRVVVDADNCTLCLACVSACPSGALLDNPDKPQLRFIESACVQCGLCRRTCPEKVISLVPQYDFTAAAIQATVLNEEEPATCVKCGKPFGTQSTINRISEKLAGQHWMFQTEDQANLIRMCDDCRVETQMNVTDNPFAGGERPRVRTTDDYLNAEEDLSADDYLIDDPD